MYFDEYGDRNNKTIVLLHCAGVLDMFAFMYHLSSEYHIVVPHLLGTGKEVHRDYSFKDSVSGIVDIINSLGKEKVYLVGHSLGANLSFELIANHEELFEKIIISSPMLTTSKVFDKVMAAYMTIAYPLLKSKIMFKAFVKLLKLNKQQTEAFRAYWGRMSAKTWRSYFMDGIKVKEYNTHKKFQIPLMLIYGDKEMRVIKNTVEEIGHLAQDHMVKSIKGQGHGHPAKRPDEFIGNMLNFFN